MAKPITYVGLDVHKDTIAVALAEAGLRGEVRDHGKIPNTPAALKALTVKLAPARRELRFCYEAGPCGYGIQRQLTGAGHECAVDGTLYPKGVEVSDEEIRAINLTHDKFHGEWNYTIAPNQQPP
jgi:transposase